MEYSQKNTQEMEVLRLGGFVWSLECLGLEQPYYK